MLKLAVAVAVALVSEADPQLQACSQLVLNFWANLSLSCSCLRDQLLGHSCSSYILTLEGIIGGGGCSI